MDLETIIDWIRFRGYVARALQKESVVGLLVGVDRSSLCADSQQRKNVNKRNRDNNLCAVLYVTKALQLSRNIS
jgi:hypothetical protein